MFPVIVTFSSESVLSPTLTEAESGHKFINTTETFPGMNGKTSLSNIHSKLVMAKYRHLSQILTADFSIITAFIVAE